MTARIASSSWSMTGTRPKRPTVAEIKAEAARRLAATDWYIVRAADPSGGAPIPDEILAQRAAIRAACEALEAMAPRYPHDFTDDRHWPV